MPKRAHDRGLIRSLRAILHRLRGRIKRKVVKQTVMTSVYGVTPLGARQQILNRLVDLHDDGAFPQAFERDDLNKMARYLADLTLNSLDESFKGATESMRWLAKAASLPADDASHLLCESPGRILDLTLILHFFHR